MFQGFLHILASTKAPPRAGKYGDLQFLALAEFRPGFRQHGAHFRIQGVQALGPVHSDHKDLSVTLCLDNSHV